MAEYRGIPFIVVKMDSGGYQGVLNHGHYGGDGCLTVWRQFKKDVIKYIRDEIDVELD